MVWARLDDAILDNPKIAMAGAIGFAMHVAGITYCCRNVLTNREDGFVPESAVRRLLDLTSLVTDAVGYCHGVSALRSAALDAAYELTSPSATAVADHLVECGLWEVAENGYKIHDFHKYNPTKIQVEEMTVKKSEAGKRGANSRWTKTTIITPAMAPAMADANHEPKQNDGRAMAKLCPDPGPDPLTPSVLERSPLPASTPVLDEQLALVSEGPKKRGKADREKRGTRCPSSDSPDAAEFCRANGLAPPTDPETADFLDYWSAVPGHKGLSLNWTATWRRRPQWLAERAKERQQTATQKVHRWNGGPRMVQPGVPDAPWMQPNVADPNADDSHVPENF